MSQDDARVVGWPEVLGAQLKLMAWLEPRFKEYEAVAISREQFAVMEAFMIEDEAQSTEAGMASLNLQQKLADTESLLAEAESQLVADTATIHEMARTIGALQSRLDAVAGLLDAAVCPMAAQGCDGTQYPVGDPHGDFHGEQCQWCHERNNLSSAALGGESHGNDEVG